MSDTARDALRRYLEQRRELGERELVLDGMSVDDVLGMLGARSRGADDVQAPADHPRLRAEGDLPRADPPEAHAAPPEAHAASDGEVSRDDASPHPTGSSDWRAALLAAGAAAPGVQSPARSQPLPPQEAPPSPTPAEEASLESRAADDAPIPVGLDVGRDLLLGGPLAHVTSLNELARLVAECTRCPLYRGAKNPVPGEGDPNADFVIVGEAPGADEDASGRPFVGASGQLLTKILGAIKLQREEVFICNVVKHRPPGNRNPEVEEVAACSPYLVRQLELLRPKVILTLGNFAAQTLLGTKLGVSKLRGQEHRYHGIPLVATYHPAALLRNPTWKRPTWEDVQLARRILDRAE